MCTNHSSPPSPLPGRERVQQLAGSPALDVLHLWNHATVARIAGIARRCPPESFAVTADASRNAPLAVSVCRGEASPMQARMQRRGRAGGPIPSQRTIHYDHRVLRLRPQVESRIWKC